ncbi:hypothetical protein, partial [Eubacterium sp.]|uniref:hypothetical protein n=1 Tax=Eubacterium sp. TaxID=142586 RepID=UPI003994CB06
YHRTAKFARKRNSEPFSTAYSVLTVFYIFAVFASSFRSPFFDKFSDFSQKFLFSIDEIAINIYYIKYIKKRLFLVVVEEKKWHLKRFGFHRLQCTATN